MSKVTHTPGPWRLKSVGGQFLEGEIIGATKTHANLPLTIASVRRITANTVAPKTADGESEANARLIFAAPDLLAACEAMLEFLPIGDYPTAGSKSKAIQTRDMVKAAIRKAKGE